VSREYADSFPFGGRIEKIDIQLVSNRPGEDADAKHTDSHVTMARQ
jgi:hypothetical protein